MAASNPFTDVPSSVGNRADPVAAAQRFGNGCPADLQGLASAGGKILRKKWPGFDEVAVDKPDQALPAATPSSRHSLRDGLRIDLQAWSFPSAHPLL